jgi:hypothetical protein
MDHPPSGTGLYSKPQNAGGKMVARRGKWVTSVKNDSAENGEGASAKHAEGCAKVRCSPLRQSGPGSER